MNLDTISVSEVEDCLSQEPFNLSIGAEAFLFARYLIEDNNEVYVEVDREARKSIQIVESILRHALGKILILSPEEEKILHQIASEVNKPGQLDPGVNSLSFCSS